MPTIDSKSKGQVHYSQGTKVPTAKVISGTIVGAIITIGVWALNAFALTKDQQITGEVSAAITTVLSAVAAYFTRPSKRDQITS